MKQHKQSGFTLLEIMVVIAIVAVLAAIALPAYTDYTRKARRSDAKVALTGLAQGQDTHYADYLRYASTIGQASEVDVSTNTNQLGCKTSCAYDSGTAYSEKGHYTLRIHSTLSSRTRYVLVAAVNVNGVQNVSQETKKCQMFALSSKGVKASWGTDDSSVTLSDRLASNDPDPQDCWGD